VTTAYNFAEKTFTNWLQTAKFAKVFSLESFPLYGTRLCRKFVFMYMWVGLNRFEPSTNFELDNVRIGMGCMNLVTVIT